MNHPALLLATLALTSGLAAQTVSASFTALAPLTAQCTIGAGTNSNAVPAGPMSPVYNATASITGQGSMIHSQAMVDGFLIPDDRQVQITASNFLFGTGVGFPQTASAEQDLLVQVSATSAAPVRVNVFPRLELSAGVPAPLLEIDVGNDGLVDWVGAYGTSELGSFVLGPQPLPIRMRLVSTLPIAPNYVYLQSTAAITLLVTPDNQLGVFQNVVGCTGIGSMEPPAPVFDGRGVDVLTNPAVFVIGSGTQPVLFGPQSPLPFLSGCLLLPTPDVLLWAPSGHLRLPLPAALRPATLYLQAVFIGPVFATSDGFLIYAY
jgi:hypothetical protein